MNKVLENVELKILTSIQAIDFSEKSLYAYWLAQTYHYLAQYSKSSYSALSMIDDQKVFRYLNLLVKAEQHKIHVIDAEIKRVGFSVEDFAINPANSLMCESQYYKILKVDPLFIFGIKLLYFYIECFIWPLIVDATGNLKEGSFLIKNLQNKKEDYDNLLFYLNTFNPEQENIVQQGIDQFSYAYEMLIYSLKSYRP